MTLRHLIAWAVSFVLLAAVPAAESPSVLLQKGIYAEETEGNLEGAIKIYEEIVKESEANRSLVAQAQYRLGVCHLKKGKKDEAEAAFRKITSQFRDQPEVIARARARLGEMGKDGSPVVARLVWSGTNSLAVDSLSPDGKHAAFIDWETGNLGIWDLATGQRRALTDNGSLNDPVQYTDSCTFSRDGKQVAYSWRGADGIYSVRSVSVEGGKPDVIISLKATNHWISTEDWAPDGRSLAGISAEGQGTNWDISICSINLEDGSVRKIQSSRSGAERVPRRVRFSSDGQYLAYNAQQLSALRLGQPVTNEIFVLDLRSGTQETGVEPVADDEFLGWSQTGLEVLFTSDRGGTFGLWSLEVQNGKAKGHPKVVRADLGNIAPVDLSRNGALFYRTEVGPAKELYRARVDFAASKVLSPPSPIRTPALSLSDKVYRSTGSRFLYFRSGYATGPKKAGFNVGPNAALIQPAAYVLDIESGTQRMLPHSAVWINRVGWWWPIREDRSLIVHLMGSAHEGGLHLVDTVSGEIKPLALHQRGVQQAPDNPVRFHPHPEFFAYARFYSNPKRIVLVKHNLESGQESEYEIPNLPMDRMSPSDLYRNRPVLLSDGRSFLFNKKLGPDLFALVRHDLETGEQKEWMKSNSPIGVIDTDPTRIFLVTPGDQDRPVFTLFHLQNSELLKRESVVVPKGFAFRGQHFGGPHLLLIKERGEDESRETLTDLWTLSVRTGELKNTGLPIPGDHYWGGDDHEQIVLFQTTTRRASSEIWVMENFLPPTVSMK